MRRAALAVLLGCGSLWAQAPAEPLVDLGGDPAHTAVLADEHVRVFRLEVAPHAATHPHRHDRDHVAVALGDADITNAVEGRAEARLRIPDGGVNFILGGFAHVIRNEADAPFRNVTVELLRPQTGARNLCEPIIAGQPTDCPAGARDTARRGGKAVVIPQLETDQTRISLLRLAPRAKYTVALSRAAGLLVALEGTEADALFEITLPGAVGKGTRRLRSADAMTCAPKMPVELLNAGRSPARFLLFEFKKD